jgi:uncharacterized Zn finger protein
MARLAKKGRIITPVKLDGRKIATTFWGKAWCDNLEAYSDFANRLPRGRTYVRNGSVVDLQIEAGQISAVVSGSELYDVKIKIKPLSAKIWSALKCDCAGKIGSLVELLQGRLAQGVMELVTRKDAGLFPAPAEIDMDCSCPDGAYMCKHIAAVLYGIGARLDHKPDLLFALRQLDHLDLITSAPAIAGTETTGRQTIAADDLADVFGIEMDSSPVVETPAAPPVNKRIARRKDLAAAPGKRTTRRVKAVEQQDAKSEIVPDRTRRTKKRPRQSGRVERGKLTDRSSGDTPVPIIGIKDSYH